MMMRWPYEWRKKEACPFLFPGLGGLLYRWDCLAENLYIRMAPLPACGLNREPRAERVTLSLTTFPARIHQCYYAIKSLMLQTFKADRIVLWLAEEQFPEHKLPPQFDVLLEAGLTVRFCEDYRSHKKYYHALREQGENELVITYDDDIIYEADSVEKLITVHQQFPDCIICNRGQQMVMHDGQLLPYSQWKLCTPVGVREPVYGIMPSTGAGCLYPCGIMPESTFDVEKARELAWTADDLWMRFNSLAAGVRVVKTRERIATLCNVSGSQKEALTQINDIGNENQRAIERLLRCFPETEATVAKDGGC